MTEKTINITVKRSNLILFILVVLALAAFIYHYAFVKVHPPSPEEVVTVSTEPVQVPEEFGKTLQSMDASAFALLDGQGRLRIVDTNGASVVSCGSQTDGSERNSCDVATDPEEIVFLMSSKGESPCGICAGRWCRKGVNRWPCSNPVHACSSFCR